MEEEGRRCVQEKRGIEKGHAAECHQEGFRGGDGEDDRSCDQVQEGASVKGEDEFLKLMKELPQYLSVQADEQKQLQMRYVVESLQSRLSVLR